ncbi:MAG: PTS mannose transporter subunit IID [Aeromonadales bacterium]|nr:PTS mannose transporter subunit IID [Aeromonadales bacterium]
MIGLVIVSHSDLVAEGICQMVSQISASGDHKLPVIAAGGTAEGKLGTDPKRILEAIKKANEGDGVVVLCDLGSGVISSQAAISMLDADLKQHVRIADAPLLEGAVGAAVEAASDAHTTLELVIAAAEASRQLHKK